MRLQVNARARTAAGGAWPWSRCCGEYTCAQKACRSDAAAPCDKRVPEALGTREAPVHRGLLAAPCGHRCDPGISLECGGGGIACALCAAGDEEPGGADGARAWEGLEQGAIAMGLRARRDGGVASGDGLPGDTALGHKGLHQERLGHDDAVSGRERWGGFDGLETLGDASSIAYVRRPEEGCEGGPAREWRRVEGWPATQEVAEDCGVLLLHPMQHGRARVREGTGEAVGAPPWVADHAAPVCDAWGESAHRGALRLERL